MRRRAAFPFVTGLALVLATAPAALSGAWRSGPDVRGRRRRPDRSHARRGPRLRGDDPARRQDRRCRSEGIGGPNPRFAIVRYETDGSLDPSFGGGDGKVSIDFTPRRRLPVRRPHPGGREDRRRRRGRTSAELAFALARLTSDGSLDPTFGGDGTVMTNVTPSYDWANGMALQPNGKIVLVGSVSAGSRQREDRRAALPLRRLARSHLRR